MPDSSTPLANRPTHQDYADAGYAPIPIIPPEAPLSPSSKIPPESRGKVPGRKYRSGWGGIKEWYTEVFIPEDLDRFMLDGAGVGLRCSNIAGLDIDVTHSGIAQAVRTLADRMLGPARVRIGREPKALMVYATPEGSSSRKLKFTDEHGTPQLVEWLGQGKQFVAEGIHPKTGKPYTWPEGDLPGQWPVAVGDQLIEAFFEELRDTLEFMGMEVGAVGGSAGLGVEVDQEGLKAVDLTEAERLIRGLPNVDSLQEVTGKEGRDHWIEMAYAFKAVFQDDPGLGEELWLDWCERWEDGGNDPEDAQREYGKCAPPYRVGWDLIERCARHVMPEERTRQAAQAFGGEDVGPLPEDPVDELLHSCVFVKVAGAYYDFRDGTLIKADAFDRAHRRLTGRNKPTTTVDVRGVPVLGMTYLPGRDRIVEQAGHRMANDYRPGPAHVAGGWLTHGPVSADRVEMFLRLLEGVVPDAREREILLDWLAWQIQRPGEKCNWHPLLIGRPGTGKDSLLLPVRAGLGHNAVALPPTAITSDYNDWVMGRSLIVWEEISTHGRREVEDLFKPYLVDEPSTLRISQKYVSGFDYPNVANHLMMTNQRAGLHLSPGERRIFVTDSGHAKGPGLEFFAQYRPWVKEGAPGSELVCRWLAGRVITENMLGTAPMTEAKENMIHVSRGNLAGEIVRLIEEREGPCARDLVTTEELSDWVAVRMRGLKLAHGPVQIGMALGEVDNTDTFRVKIGGKTRRVWAVRDGVRYADLFVTKGGGALVEECRRQEREVPSRLDKPPFDPLGDDD